MSIQSEINRISNNVAQSLAILASEGAGSGSGSNDLPGLIQELAYRYVDCGLFGEAYASAAIDCGSFGDSTTGADFDCGTF